MTSQQKKNQNVQDNRYSNQSNTPADRNAARGPEGERPGSVVNECDLRVHEQEEARDRRDDPTQDKGKRES